MDVRGRRLRKQSDRVTAFTSSMAFDGEIAGAVVRVNMAHMVALIEGGEVDPRVGAKCLRFLLKPTDFSVPTAKAEDFHQYLEQKMVDAIGIDAAGHLNLGKSRNDQVAAAIRIRLKEKLLELISETRKLQGSLLKIVAKQGARPIPGYTHLQRAQPITLGHHYLAYFDSLERSIQRLLQLYARADLSPMGSAALGGTSVNVDRERVALLLGFRGVTSNAMDSVASRDLLSEALSCCAMLMVDLSRLSEEVIIWSSKEFGFVEVDDEYATSSSIMPQKKNPVVAEVTRSKFGSVLGALVAVLSITKSLPFAYNMDLQEATLHLWRGMDDTTASLGMMAGMLASSRFNFDTIAKSMAGDYSTATALANHFVSAYGIPFRTAHAMVGELVRASMAEGVSLERAAARHAGEVSSRLGKEVVISEKEAAEVLRPSSFLSEIRTKGGSNPRFLRAEVAARSRQLGSSQAALAAVSRSKARSEVLLTRTATLMARGVKR